jgi:hypothetical protein
MNPSLIPVQTAQVTATRDLTIVLLNEMYYYYSEVPVNYAAILCHAWDDQLH